MKEQTDLQLYSLIVAGQHYAVRAADVKEIPDRRELSAITPIFHAPHVVRGYVNIRGEINLVIDLRRLLGEDDSNDQGDLIFFHESIGPSFGIMVDLAGKIFTIKTTQMEEWTGSQGDENENTPSRFTTAVYKADKELISILDPKRFLEIN